MPGAKGVKFPETPVAMVALFQKRFYWLYKRVETNPVYGHVDWSCVSAGVHC